MHRLIIIQRRTAGLSSASALGGMTSGSTRRSRFLLIIERLRRPGGGMMRAGDLPNSIATPPPPPPPAAATLLRPRLPRSPDAAANGRRNMWIMAILRIYESTACVVNLQWLVNWQLTGKCKKMQNEYFECSKNSRPTFLFYLTYWICYINTDLSEISIPIYS